MARGSLPVVHSLSASALLALCTGASAQPTSGTYDVVLTGKVRDFPASHPDFCKSPTFGQNWVEGGVAHTLNAQGLPVWSGQGKRVLAPARDGSGRNIAQGMMQSTVLTDLPDVILVSPPTIVGTATWDTYNPNLGPYGGTNIGPAPEVAVAQTMPTVNVPSMGTYMPAYVMMGIASGTLSSSFRCGTFNLKNQYTLTIVGDVTIVVDTLMLLENSSSILIAPNSRLTMYVLGSAIFENGNQVNMNTGDKSLFTLYLLGPGDLDIGNAVDVCGTFIAPQGRLYMHNDGEFYGDVVANRMELRNSSMFHAAEPFETPCVEVDDTPASVGGADPASVASNGTFAQWFNEVPGVNMEAQARMVFSKDATGALKYSTNDFRPIDGEMLEEGAYGANRNFTLEMDGSFYYTPCSGQFLEFFGDGDAFVYVDGKLVLEMAGNNLGITQYVDMDRLGLTPGEAHELKFFYAQRSCGASRFSLRTNVDLMTTYTVEIESVALLD